METLRKTRKGRHAIKIPESANMARKLNTLLRLTETAWPNANRRSIEKDPCEPTTAIGNRTKEAAFTTMVSRAVSTKMENRFAKKILASEMGRDARLT